MNPIKKYIIRQPGCTAWAETRGKLNGRAKKLLREAQAKGIPAKIFAEHDNGDVTGPYLPE